jgi:hypothetical protein
VPASIPTRIDTITRYLSTSTHRCNGNFK